MQTGINCASPEKIPIFTQNDVVKYYNKEDKKSVTIFIAEEQEDSYLSTLKIVKQFKNEAIKQNWKNVLVVAHSNHVCRCVRDLKKHGFVITAKKCPSIYWNKNDSQVWVRNPLFWWTREIILRILPFHLYEWLCA